MKLPHSLFWAGSSLEFIFTGETLHLGFTADFTYLEPWVSAELNGAPLLRIPLERGSSRVCLFRGMTAGVFKHVRIFKDTQPITDDPRHRLEIVEVTGTGGVLLPSPPKPLYLEFIGDSLTSGEGIAGAREETDWISPLFCASRSWARRTADLLQADFYAVSQSGWGVCSGWDGDTSHAIPPWYEKTRPLRNREPDAVIVNLGTNDANAIRSGLGPVGADGFEEGALSFLRQLREAHPSARLVWAYGMLDDPLRPQLERAVEAPDLISELNEVKGDPVAEAARMLAANGITAWLYPRLEPTPALSWAVRYLGCGAGVCVTASHCDGHPCSGGVRCRAAPDPHRL